MEIRVVLLQFLNDPLCPNNLNISYRVMAEKKKQKAKSSDKTETKAKPEVNPETKPVEVKEEVKTVEVKPEAGLKPVEVKTELKPKRESKHHHHRHKDRIVTEEEKMKIVDYLERGFKMFNDEENVVSLRCEGHVPEDPELHCADVDFEESHEITIYNKLELMKRVLQYPWKLIEADVIAQFDDEDSGVECSLLIDLASSGASRSGYKSPGGFEEEHEFHLYTDNFTDIEKLMTCYRTSIEEP